MPSRTRVWVLLAMLMALLAWGMAQAPAAEPTNAVCPVMEGEPVDPEIFTDFDGRRIWFCSDVARELFLAAPEDYLKNLPELAPTGGPRFPSISAREVPGGKAAVKSAPKLSLLQLVGRMHPAAVHLPIGLVVGAFAAALCRALAPSARWTPPAATVLFLMVIAAPGAVGAATSGWLLAGDQALEGPVGELLEVHRWLGIGSASLIALATLVVWRLDEPKNRWLIAGILAALTMLVGATGHIGGALVYGMDYLPF